MYVESDLPDGNFDCGNENELIAHIISRPDRFVGALDRTNVVSVNCAAIALAGYSLPEVAIAQGPPSFVQGAARSAWPAQLAAIALGRTQFVREVVGQSDNGLPLACKIYWQATETDGSGTPTRAIVAVVDQTPHAKRRESLDNLDQAKSDLLKGLAADFERPVAMASAALTKLAGDPVFATGPRAEGPVRSIKESVKAARDLAGDMVAAPSRASVPPVAESVVLELEVRRALASLRASDVAAVEVLGAGVAAQADAGLVRQILRCLVSNSVAHGRPPIVIDLRYGSTEALIDVIDHGHGVAEGTEDDIFEEGRHRNRPGSCNSSFTIDLPLLAVRQKRWAGRCGTWLRPIRQPSVCPSRSTKRSRLLVGEYLTADIASATSA